MRRAKFALPMLSVLLFSSATASGLTIVSTVGDVDGFHSGDPADAPYRSATIQSRIDVPFMNLDQPMTNKTLGFTHIFHIPVGQTITSATLVIGVYPGSGTIETDCFALDVFQGSGTQFGPRAVFKDILGYTPERYRTTAITMNLAAVPMRPSESGSATLHNLLPQLMDGELNVLEFDDSGVDYSVLTIETVPEPVSLLLMSAGLLALRRRRIA